MQVRRYGYALGVIGLLALGACGGVADPSTNTITTLAGTLEVNGVVAHQVSVSKNGEFDARITALAPQSSTFIGLQWGPLINGVCAGVFQQNFFATLDRIALAGAVNRGDYCLTVFDVGTLTERNTYTLRVSHP